MKRALLLIILCWGAAGPAQEAAESPAPAPAAQAPTLWDRMQEAIRHHLGRPYVWGATGLKSYDCSGFVWRVFAESGLLMKRTTARKLYFSLPRVPKERQWESGNIVFFNDLKHVGIVAGAENFYHSQSSIGTNLSRFVPYWRPKIVGFRAVAAPPELR